MKTERELLLTERAEFVACVAGHGSTDDVTSSDPRSTAARRHCS